MPRPTAYIQTLAASKKGLMLMTDNMKQAIILFVFIWFPFSVFGQDSLVWDFLTEGRVYSSPTVDDSTLFIGSSDSCLYVLNKRDGKLKRKF